MVASSLAPGPYTPKLGYTDEERARIRSRLRTQGVREFPYPFASAMSVISDCDGSSRTRYEAYVGAFNRLGLDFGDSTWLHWMHRVDWDIAEGLGFFSFSYSKGLAHDVEWMFRTRTFAHSIAEFHAGNIDHFHSLFRDGPRVAVVECETADGDVEIPTGPFQIGGPWRASDLHLFGLLIDGVCEGAGIVEEDGTETSDFHRLPSPREDQTLFALPFDPDAENRAPQLRATRVVRLSGARGVRRVVLLSAHSRLVLERLERLRRYNVEIGLITEHSRLYFRNLAGAVADDTATKERLRTQEGPVGAIYGAISNDEGLIVSTDADDPASICKVLPEMFDLGLRFLVPMAAASSVAWDPLEVVSPTPTRAGGGAYWAQRTMPLRRELPGATRQETFVLRMMKALGDAGREPGGVWPIYTHLGAMASDAGRFGNPVIPEPYFEEDAMLALRDAAMGVRKERPRMWFTRATTLYDYCLIVGSIAEHVRRRGDTIDIASWRDKVLGRTLPISPAQLYGLTFYVKDAAKAVVRLDGRVIDTLSRNRPDETRRQSVTILESEIRTVLFDALNPLANYPDEAEISGECEWRDGYLAVDGAVTLPLHGLSLPSAQALTFAAKGVFGVRLRTEDGGAFYFGDPKWAQETDHATYAFPKRDGGVFVVPFHDLDWRANADVHAPSHPLASITLMGRATFAKVALLRPRATTLDRTGFCVAGRVADFEPGQVVDLEGRQEVVDQRGWFCFWQVPKGVHRLTSNGRCDRRGPLIEVGSDVSGLVVDRVC
ncbi:MAG: hypothetical protein ABI306_02490 [Caulobacteraceae bacterium]